MSVKKVREVKQVIKGTKTADGNGVQLTRLIGSSEMMMHDPFLLMDAFGSNSASDYIGGFPPHPHRGFETVTYMLAGKMRHKDSAGHEGVIESGGVQWMTAGKGIVHSEMPEQESGLLSGLQLWVNLPKADKMKAPEYQEYNAEEIAVDNIDDGSFIKVVAGETANGIKGIIKNNATEPTYWDVTLNNSTLSEKINAEHNALIYVISGHIAVGDNATQVSTGQLAVLSQAQQLKVNAADSSRFVVIAGQPLNEPVVRGGPFVMNTRAEIQQAFKDHQAGRIGV